MLLTVKFSWAIFWRCLFSLKLFDIISTISTLYLNNLQICWLRFASEAFVKERHDSDRRCDPGALGQEIQEKFQVPIVVVDVIEVTEEFPVGDNFFGILPELLLVFPHHPENTWNVKINTEKAINYLHKSSHSMGDMLNFWWAKADSINLHIIQICQ